MRIIGTMQSDHVVLNSLHRNEMLKTDSGSLAGLSLNIDGSLHLLASLSRSVDAIKSTQRRSKMVEESYYIGFDVWVPHSSQEGELRIPLFLRRSVVGLQAHH